MFRNSTRGSFLVDLTNASIEIYHYRDSMVVSRITKWFGLFKALGVFVTLDLFVLEYMNRRTDSVRCKGF